MIDFNTHNPTAEQMPQNQQHNNMVYQLNAPSHLPVTANTPENYFNNQYQTETSNSGMRSNFPLAVNPLSSAPLAALHSMAGSGDMKTSQAMTSPTLAGYNPAAYYSMKNGLNCLNGTPHGITDILSRPDLQALQARLGQGMYYNSCSQGGGQMGSPSKDSRHVYWTSSDGQPINNMHHQQEGWPLKHDVGIEKGPDGKKKNTRPTFSGSQIFALEKTFEQQKYLAGPERGRLAYALGMSESQVKVWFQNRRTKWRKRHAVEQVSKRRGGNPPSQTPPSYEQSQKSNQLSTSNFDNINIGGNNLHTVLN